MSARRACLALGPMLSLLLAAPLTAQQPASVRGIVVDALTGDPLRGALIRRLDGRGGAVADSLGRFVVPVGGDGLLRLAVHQYGYEERTVALEAGPLTRVELDPGPLALAGFTVIAERIATMEERFEERRHASAFTARALDADRLMASPAADMVEFLALEASLRPASCGGRATSSCVIRRGREVEPRVYIDEGLAVGGMDQLATYRPHDLFLVEVFAGGLEIRAYTHRFMERAARRPIHLIPFGAGWR